MLDAVQNGATVVIERYNKSIGVLVPIDKWQAYERIEAAIAEAKQARARRAAGETRLTSSAEMTRLMAEKRAAGVGSNVAH